MRSWLLAIAVVSAIGCMPPQPPDTPLTTNTEEDPDALCAGAERVFLRHALPLRSDTCATEARVIVTDFASFERLKLITPYENAAQVHKSFSVIISRKTVEISAICATGEGDGKLSPPGDCSAHYATTRDPSAITKDRLLNEIMAESRLVAGARRTREQSSTPSGAALPSPAASGCSKDTDCKGDRVCVKGECADPAAK